MANTVNINTILDGTRDTIIRVDIVGDGSGEETGTIIYDASAYDNKTAIKKVYQIQYCLTGFSTTLYWDSTGTPPSPLIAMLEADHYARQEYNWFGGLSNATVTGSIGDILLTTRGLTATDRGYIIIHVQHKEIKAGER